MSMLTSILNRAYSRPSTPILITGDPGTGKTAMIEEWANRHSLPLVKLLASTLDETDVAGIVVKKGDSAVTLSPGWVKTLATEGILFLDEFNTARKEVLDTLLTLICSRHLPNGDKIGDKVIIIAAMNDANQCDNTELSPAMKNRFGQFYHQSSEGDWFDYILGEDLKEEAVDPLLEPLTMSQWLSKFRTDPNFEPDKKEMLRQLRKSGFKFDREDDYLKADTATSARSMTNLLYWTLTAKEAIETAGAFVSDKAIEILESLNIKAINDVANSLFNREKEEASGKESSLKAKRQRALNKVTQKVAENA